MAGSPGESFLYTPKTGKFSLISPTDSYAGINNDKEIVGSYGGVGSNLGFLIPKSGSFQTLLPPGATTSTANSINNLGEVLGTDQSQGPSQYYLFRSGTFTSITLPGYAGGLNSSGEIVGSYNPAFSGNLGYLYQKGTVTSIKFPSSTQTYASDINDLGDIVGYFVNSSGASHAFLLHKNVYTEIVVPGETQPGGTNASGINNCGQVVGSYYAADGGTYGFLATPANPDKSGMTPAQLKSCGYAK
jgi:probable HAF family extracellular repeat protein